MLLESGRTVPRRRRRVPAWLLDLMWPLFRYSDERGAWVMRLIGERFGPVLLGPVTPVPVLPADDRRRGLLRSGRVLILALGAAALAVAVGFVVERATTGARTSAARERVVSAVGVEVVFPVTWGPRPETFSTRLGLGRVLSMGPPGSRRKMLVVGRAATPDPQLLPRPLLTSLASPPTPQAVTLGGTRFYRYSGVSVRGEPAVQSVYALPTTSGTIVGICAAPAPVKAFVSDCERMLGTLRLVSGRALPLGPDRHYASLLDQVVSQLNAARRSGSAALLAARAPSAQASAANALAAAHAHAATQLAAVNAGPASKANSALVSALHAVASDYRALASAAARGNAAAYSAARASVQNADRALAAAFAGLSAYGYTAR